jgi:hypothetical protein
MNNETCRRNLSMQPTHVSCMSRLCHPHTAALLHLRRWLLSSASSELQRRGSSCCCSRKACLACRLLIYVPCTRLHVHMHACMHAGKHIHHQPSHQPRHKHTCTRTHTYTPCICITLQGCMELRRLCAQAAYVGIRRPAGATHAQRRCFTVLWRWGVLSFKHCHLF